MVPLIQPLVNLLGQIVIYFMIAYFAVWVPAILFNQKWWGFTEQPTGGDE